ncbi:NAD(P)/FAD-dependent oxidoreductase [Glycomyces harbinensis]|uniref:Glycine/D-amino acid oxidase n=1 Tax=Glycomyces harbinensis TaxID=58114 RepID=A0A1G6ZK33_9ACTN|nr:FAD-binding oxidoreductase [Glycomyces harbinensis]SDE02782.1 Glycine/D-amino acid oxidase [Glycomyces harbinensis]
MDAVDLAVIGGGVIGAVTAYEAAAAFPGADIAVLERGLVGGGATSRSAGVHFPRGATARVRSMTEHSHRYWQRLAAELGLPVHPTRATVRASAERADAVRGAYLELGAETEPDPGTREWVLDGCHYADVEGVARAILTDLRPRATVWEGVEVAALDGDDGWVLTLGHGETLRARRVVLAPGPWIAHPAWADLIAPLGLRVKKIVAAHLDTVPGPGDALAVFDDEDAFVLPLHHRGHFLFSYTCDEWDVDPDTVERGLAPSDLADARAVLRRHAPNLAPLCRSGRVFCDAYSPAREPVVAELCPGLVFAGAAGGSGYRLAPAIAAEAVAALASATSHPSNR